MVKSGNHFLNYSQKFWPFSLLRGKRKTKQKQNGEKPWKGTTLFFVPDGLLVISPVITLINRNLCLNCISTIECRYGTNNSANGWKDSFRNSPKHTQSLNTPELRWVCFVLWFYHWFWSLLAWQNTIWCLFKVPQTRIQLWLDFIYDSNGWHPTLVLTPFYSNFPNSPFEG